jgi:hypothetical protein
VGANQPSLKQSCQRNPLESQDMSQKKKASGIKKLLERHFNADGNAGDASNHHQAVITRSYGKPSSSDSTHWLFPS